MRSIFLLYLVARCLGTIDVCVYGASLFYVCCTDCVGEVCWLAAVVKDSVFLALEY